jgi:sarcosine oxidase, subunit beta
LSGWGRSSTRHSDNQEDSRACETTVIIPGTSVGTRFDLPGQAVGEISIGPKPFPKHIREKPLSTSQQNIPSSVDVAIIGAGVVGCSIAYQLAKRGKSVTVFDMRGICSGASGRNGGMTGTGSALHSAAGDAVYALTSENFSMLQDELARELDNDFSLLVTGGIDIATTEEQASFLKQAVEHQRGNGIDVEWLDGPEARELVPALSDRVYGVEWKKNSGHLWPFQLVNALANGARQYNARFITHTPVKRVVYQNGEISGIETDEGIVEAGSVVVATNAWTRDLLPDLPEHAITPSRGQILVTQPVGQILPMPFSTNYDKEYGRQTHSGQILCGGFRRLDVDEGLGLRTEAVHPPAVGGIANCLASIFPQLRDLRVVRTWAGLMGFTADGLPMIGSYGDVRGLYVAAGFNGGGFSYALTTGKAMAQLVANGRSTLDIEPFNPDRFASGEATWENPFTAGERNNPRKLTLDA